MKHVAAVLALVAALISGCAPSKAEIEDSAKKLTQEIIQKNVVLKDLGLVVDRVDAVNESGNKYKGIAQVAMDGEHYPVALSIVADGDKVMVNVDDGAFLFAAQKVMRNAMAEAAAHDVPAVQPQDAAQHDEAHLPQAEPKEEIIPDRPSVPSATVPSASTV